MRAAEPPTWVPPVVGGVVVTGRRARAGWLVCMVILAPAAAAGLTISIRNPDIVSSVAFLEVMDRLGVSPAVAGWVGFVLPTASAFIVACVIRRGRPSDPVALLFGLSLLSLFLIVAGVGTALATAIPRPAARVVDVLASVLVIFGLYLFPNGHFVPRWTRWLVLVVVVGTVAFPDILGAARSVGLDTKDSYPEGVKRIANALTVVLLGTWLPTQIYRYRRRSTPLERLQTRWVIFGFALIIIASSSAVILRTLGVSPTWVAWPLLAAAVGSLILPVAAGLAILRYHLYEIDRIISRAISYALLVGLLAGLYGAGVFALTTVVPATGDLAVAGSTLAVAALFNPLRRRIQTVVDRRFNRSRYDANLLIDSFAVKLRSRADLAEVVSDLRGVLVHTVEPSSAMIWLRDL